MVAGWVAAVSGLWTAMFYAIGLADSALLHGLRLFFGFVMALSILLGCRAVRLHGEVGEYAEAAAPITMFCCGWSPHISRKFAFTASISFLR